MSRREPWIEVVDRAFPGHEDLVARGLVTKLHYAVKKHPFHLTLESRGVDFNVNPPRAVLYLEEKSAVPKIGNQEPMVMHHTTSSDGNTCYLKLTIHALNSTYNQTNFRIKIEG